MGLYATRIKIESSWHVLCGGNASASVFVGLDGLVIERKLFEEAHVVGPPTEQVGGFLGIRDDCHIEELTPEVITRRLCSSKRT